MTIGTTFLDEQKVEKYLHITVEMEHTQNYLNLGTNNYKIKILKINYFIFF